MSLRTRHLILGAAVLVLVVGGLAALSPAGLAGLAVLTVLGGLVLLWAGGWLLQRGFSGAIRQVLDRVRQIAGAAAAVPRGRRAMPAELEALEAAIHLAAEEVAKRTADLEGERDELQEIIDSIAEGVIALTLDARILRMNPAAAELLDVARPPVLAPIGTLVRHTELRDHLEESVMFPLAPREIQVGARHLRISSHLIQGRGSVVMFLDVTKLRLAEQVRKDFVANASHELKTPLTAVRGFAETLLEDDPPEALRREFLASIRKNTIRLQNLVDDLLDLSHLESGGWIPSEETVRVAGSAREVWAGLAPEQRAGGVHFSVQGDGVVLADPQALHQIFRNLYDNALRYTPAGGRIGVTIVPNGSYVRVTVTDSGTGISSGALPRIFERFYRADSGRGRDAGGTGLGLAIVRHLVQSMDGDVGAESELGRGTAIRFDLPGVPWAGAARSA
ncbi:MAG: ATP-binding protein [Gammaproteobacteria bacterium]|nr:ATP-binding protein [Gammaproteobacteria bacterium]